MATHSLSDSFPYLICLLLAAVFAMESRGETTLCSPPGIEISEVLPGEDINYNQLSPDSTNLPSNDNVAAVFADSSLVVINLVDGSVKLRIPSPEGRFDLDSCLHIDGDVFYFATKVSEYPKPDKIVLRALNLTTGQWIWTRTKSIREGFAYSSGPRASIGIHAGEVRVTISGGQIVRWNLADLTSLPTLYFDGETNSNGPVIASVIGVSMGNSFCVGISQSYRDLVFESEGESTLKSFPDSLSNSNGSYAASQEYLVVPAGRYYGSTAEGFSVWNLKSANSPPGFLPHLSRLRKPTFRIWKEKFLVVVSADQEGPHGENKFASVYDLASLEKAPVIVDLPEGLPFPYGIGIVEKDLWLFDTSSNAIAWVRNVASSTFCSIHVDGARAPEAEGVLRFNVKSEGSLVEPVTVHLKTRSGSAKEGADYIGYEGTVTLTPENPEAQISISILKDTVLEAFESMIIEIAEVNGAWRGNRFANGIIMGSGFSELNSHSTPPGGNATYSGIDWALTSEGVVAGVRRSVGKDRYYVKGFGQEDVWVEIGSLAVYSANNSLRSIITGVYGNLVCASVSAGNSSNVWERKLIVSDVKDDLQVAAVEGSDVAVAMGESGFVVLFQDGRLRGHRYGSNDIVWERRAWTGSVYGTPGGIAGFDSKSFIYDNADRGLSVCNISDGSVVIDLPRLLDDGIQPLNGGPENWRCVTENYQVVGNRNSDGHPFLMMPIRPGLGDSTGLVTGANLGLFVDGNSVLTQFDVVDCMTGAKFQKITGKRAFQMGAAAGVFGVMTSTNELNLYSSQPHLPGPAITEFIRDEGDGAVPWNFGLAEAADFPVTVRVTSQSDDIEVKGTVTIPAGEVSAPFPAVVVVDDIPEHLETVPLDLEVSGNGKVVIYKVNVTIPANQYVQIHTLEEGLLLRGGSSIDIEGSGFVVGSVPGSKAVDMRYDRTHFAPGQNVGYGYAVACNKNFMAVSSVLVKSPAAVEEAIGGSVSVYDRESGEAIKGITDKLSGSGFGCVLHMDDLRLFAGAPGLARKGSVTSFEFKTGKMNIIEQPGSGKTATRFGAAITSKGNQLWIGAPQASDGRVYQYDVQSGMLIRILKAPEEGFLNFGNSLEIVGGYLMVGAPTTGKGAAVFLFNVNTGGNVRTIYSPFPDGGNFGASLSSPDRNILAVGCPDSTFSQDGGVLLYDLADKTPRLIAMLRPGENIGPNDHEHLRGMGLAGGLTGSKGILGLAMNESGSSLDVLRYSHPDVEPRVGIIRLSDYLPGSVGKPGLRYALRVDGAHDGSLWEKALGAGASERDCMLDFSRSGEHIELILPAIAHLTEGAGLILEKSDNLTQWVPIARMLGGSSTIWTAVTESDEFDFSHNPVTLPPDKACGFFRIRCEAP